MYEKQKDASLKIKYFRRNLLRVMLSYIKEINMYYFIDNTIFYKEIIQIFAVLTVYVKCVIK